MSEVSDWFKSLPIFTRYWFSLTIAFSLIGRFGIISVVNLILLYEPFIHNFEIWRAITSTFYYPTSFHLLMNLYFLYNYSLRLETREFEGRPADYFYLLLFNWIFCVTGGLLLGFRILMVSLLLSVIYIWCQLNKDAIVQFWFGVQFKAMYLPWILFCNEFHYGSRWITRTSRNIEWSFVFLFKIQVSPRVWRSKFTEHSISLGILFPPRHNNVRGFGAAPQQSAGPVPRGHNWGRGNVLGQ